jgi:hypothetical protein
MKSDDLKADLSLLVPVHEEHLLSGLPVCAKQGAVMFGTKNEKTLTKFVDVIGGGKVDVLFYASHASVRVIPSVTYVARFVEFFEAHANGKAPPAYVKYRPPSTKADTSWRGFYLVRDLQKLLAPVPIETIHKRSGKGKLGPNFVPHGPLIVISPL